MTEQETLKLEFNYLAMGGETQKFVITPSGKTAEIFSKDFLVEADSPWPLDVTLSLYATALMKMAAKRFTGPIAETVLFRGLDGSIKDIDPAIIAFD